MYKIQSGDGTRIACRRSGTGTPLLLVHGCSADHSRWSLILPALEKHFTVYAMDRRGRGYSGDTGPYAIRREFEDVAAIVDSLADTGKVDVIAHSFGATCAFEAALLTDHIRKLVLYEPAQPGFRESPDVLAKMREQLETGDREGLLSTFLLGAAGLTPAELEIVRSVSSWKGRVEAAHTILRELDSIAEHPPFDRHRFGQLNTPTLLLLGGESHVVYKETIEQIHAILPDSRIVVLPGQKHVAINTAPDLFAREVLDFLLQ